MDLIPIPKYGYLMAFAEFKASVECKALIDYDGEGCWATAELMDDASFVKPSTINEKPDWATHVVWFNR